MIGYGSNYEPFIFVLLIIITILLLINIFSNKKNIKKLDSKMDENFLSLNKKANDINRKQSNNSSNINDIEDESINVSKEEINEDIENDVIYSELNNVEESDEQLTKLIQNINEDESENIEVTENESIENESIENESIEEITNEATEELEETKTDSPVKEEELEEQIDSKETTSNDIDDDFAGLEEEINKTFFEEFDTNNRVEATNKVEESKIVEEEAEDVTSEETKTNVVNENVIDENVPRFVITDEDVNSASEDELDEYESKLIQYEKDLQKCLTNYSVKIQNSADEDLSQTDRLKLKELLYSKMKDIEIQLEEQRRMMVRVQDALEKEKATVEIKKQEDELDSLITELLNKQN